MNVAKLIDRGGQSRSPFNHVGDGGLASVRVVREASALADVELVEHEERGEVTEGRSSNGPSDSSTSAILGFKGENALDNGSGEIRHCWWWWW